MKLNVFTDGGARGNPGPAAIGVVIKLRTKNLEPRTDEGKTIASFGKYIGETTNNVAEYTAVVEALKWIASNFPDICHAEFSSASPPEEILKQVQDDDNQVQNDGTGINFFLDSNLIVNQLNGLFKIKDNKLRELALVVYDLETKINVFPIYVHIPREKNWQADKLVNSALDSFHVPSADTKAQKE